MKTSEYERDREWNIKYGSAHEIGQSCQLIHTATNAREPILKEVKKQPFCHITCVGADTPGKQEIASDIVKSADLVLYDHKEQVTFNTSHLRVFLLPVIFEL